MSDAMLGFLILTSPVYVTILMWPRLRRIVWTPIRGLVRFAGLTLAVLGIMIVGGEPKRQLIASIYKHGTDAERPGRHAAPDSELEPVSDRRYLDTALDDVPAPIPARPGLEPYTPEWYEVIYD